MSLKIKFSKKYYEKKKRIEQMPNAWIGMALAVMKRDALEMCKQFHEGIRNNALGLKALKRGTITRKIGLGYERPLIPMYGQGDWKRKNSYINMLRIRKLKNGYKVAPSWGKHWSGNLSLKKMYFVHEFGTIIKRGNVLIRIPSRPAFLKAYELTLRKRGYEPKEIKEALTHYVNTGNKTRSFRYFSDKILKGYSKYEIND